MRVLSIKYLLVLMLFTLLALAVNAQVFSKLIPQYVSIQHAGSIGYFSLGAGYELFNSNRGSLEFNFGLVPENKGGPLHIISTKFAYRPFQIKLKDIITIYPLNPGAFFSYHLDKQFEFIFDREQYGKGYYGWSEAFRAHISVSNEVKLTTRGKIKLVTLYSEFNTNDLYLASFFYRNNSKSLTPKDILKLGLGVKFGF